MLNLLLLFAVPMAQLPRQPVPRPIPLERPADRAPANACDELWECMAAAMTEYSLCIVWAVVDSDVDRSNRCALEANSAIHCCRAPGARPACI